MSEIGIARQQVASANVQSTVGAEALEQARGARKGDSAVAVPNNSDLSDIMEEIGNAVGKFADKKTLGQAKVRQGAGVNIEALKRIADYYDKLPDMPREAEMRNLISKFQSFENLLGEGGSGAGNLSADDILQALREFDGDVTHQFEALQVARHYFEATGGSSEILGLLDQAQIAFEDADIARDVQAGYAIAAQASETAATIETDPAALRDSYREMLRSPMHLGQLFDTLSEYNMRLNFDEVVGLFLETAGNELANTSSLTDPVLLGGLTKELGKLKEMRTVFQASDALIVQTQRIDPDFANGVGGVGPTELTSAMLNYCAKPSPSLADAQGILKDFNQHPESTVVTFANGLHDLHRLISDRSYPSDSARVQQGKMIEALRIDLSAAEEAAFEVNAD